MEREKMIIMLDKAAYIQGTIEATKDKSYAYDLAQDIINILWDELKDEQSIEIDECKLCKFNKEEGIDTCAKCKRIYRDRFEKAEA